MTDAFTWTPLERALACLTRGRREESLLSKLVPSHLHYRRGAIRSFERDGIRMEADISDYVGHGVYFGVCGEEERSYARLFSLGSPGYSVIDVGANIGWAALNLARVCAPGEVLAFEPNAANYARCAGNVALNPEVKAEVFALAAGERDGSAAMEITRTSNLGGNRIVPGSRAGSIRVVALDDFAPAQKLARLGLIKIDAEGYELKVLRGARRLIERHKPALFIELNDSGLREQGDSAKALVGFLEELGYRVEHAQTGETIHPDGSFPRHFDVIARSL